MIHRFREDDGHRIWLDVDESKKTGLCIGAGSSYTQARAEAITTLRAALKELEAEAKRCFPQKGGRA